MKSRSKSYIKDVWENQAIQFKDSHWASWGDKYAMELEIKNISKHINKGDVVLDVGCAKGITRITEVNIIFPLNIPLINILKLFPSGTTPKNLQNL
ncbi:hypothetical protein ES705_44500 [subsurface metagenome]